MQQKQRMTAAGIHILLILVSITMLVPFVWMALTAFKTITESTSVDPFVIFPSSWKPDNFATVINNMNFPVLYVNTLLLILGRVVCAVLTATMAGYAFGRLEFPGRNLMFSLVMFQMMVPGQIFIIPQYLMVSSLYGNGIRNLPVKTDLHEPSERFGRSSKTGRLQYRSDLPVYHGSAYPFRYGISGHFYCSICI